MEKWDIFDANGIPTGKVTTRGRAVLRPGEYHLVVHIWVVSSSGKFLLQRRSDKKKLMPGEWAATGGAAIRGETSFRAAQRELFEELGIESSSENLMKLTRIKRKNSFVDVWMIVSDAKISDLKLQKSEVAEAKWVSKAELEEMIAEGKYHNYGDEYFDCIFEKIDDFRGAYI